MAIDARALKIRHRTLPVGCCSRRRRGERALLVDPVEDGGNGGIWDRRARLSLKERGRAARTCAAAS
jgi:hypothetical protein